MQEKLKNFIDSVFEDAPKNKKAEELKCEILQNMTDKYNDLIAEGKNEETAYNLTVASIGDVGALIKELQSGGQNCQTDSSENSGKKHALLLSISIFMYIICVIPLFIFQNELGLILMFVIAATATAMIIYNSAVNKKSPGGSGTVVEDFKEWNNTNKEKNSLQSAISSAIFLLATAIYLYISFSTGAWHITWLVFLIASAINNIFKTIIK